MPEPTVRRRFAALTLTGAGLLVAGCGGGSSTSIASPRSASQSTGSPPASPTVTASSPSTAVAGPPLVARLSDRTADLHSRPVSIPMRFKASTIGVDIPLDAVGLDQTNAMDAPGVGQEKSAAGDPYWNTGFWYRGGVDPGQPGVATVAGHLDDILGRPAAFWNLRKLQAGDVLEIDDLRSGAVIHFTVTQSQTYSLAQSSTPQVLAQLFGPEAAVSLAPRIPADGIARLSLVTCAGTFTRGEYDHRYVVYAVRTDGPGSASNPGIPASGPAPVAASGPPRRAIRS